ncbi:MAG TPA: 50S ribosomal protein L18 [Firmicutes bacterium]|nr:50S ribosomal protein L18 [Bacillota bacterium]
MIKQVNRNEKRKARHKRIRKKVSGTSSRPRVCIYKSLKHIYLQAIDDENGHTLIYLSTLTPEIRETLKGKKNKEAYILLGQKMADLLLEKGIKTIIFDRSGYMYHGNIKALCEEMRKKGIEF